jgi:putative DNA primase/helicase
MSDAPRIEVHTKDSVAVDVPLTIPAGQIRVSSPGVTFVVDAASVVTLFYATPENADKYPGYSECVECPSSGLVHYLPGTKLWIDDRGCTHNGHVLKWRLQESSEELQRQVALKQTIAKREGQGWELVPSKLADYVLAASAVTVATFMDDHTIITYDRVENPGVWNLNGEDEIKALTQNVANQCGPLIKEQLSNHLIAETLGCIERSTYIDRENFKPPPDKIPLANGVYNLTTNQLEHHSMSNDFLYQIPVHYDPNAACPRIDKFLEETLGDRKTLAYEIAGYALAESTPNKWQRAFMMIGPGDNGKSTFLNLITELLGDENVSNQTLQALVENRFSAAALHLKLANIAADIGDRSLYSTWQFKALTGGDKISAEHKFKDSFQFGNRAILMFSCNSLPESYDDSDAFHKRWILIPFENTFTGDKKDSKLLEKLSESEELSGFFNRAIAAYREMDNRGAFTGEGTTEQKRDHYTRLSDPVHCFIEECILFDPEGMVNKQQLYTDFRTYAQKRGYGKTFTQKRFFKKFREKAGEQLYESYVKDGDGVQRRIYKGIKLEPVAQTTLEGGGGTTVLVT